MQMVMKMQMQMMIQMLMKMQMQMEMKLMKYEEKIKKEITRYEINKITLSNEIDILFY